MAKKVPIEVRFWPKVNKNGPTPAHCVNLGPCWEWTGSIVGGYGHVRYGGKVVIAHRLAWFMETGKWPEPSCLHKCDNPACLRFSHLFEGNHKDNAQDASKKGRSAFGDRNFNCKLNPQQVLEIRDLLGAGERHKDIAKKYGVGEMAIHRILHRITYAWVKTPLDNLPANPVE